MVEIIEHVYESRRNSTDARNKKPRPPSKNCVQHFVSYIRKKIRAKLDDDINPIIPNGERYRLNW